jgi:LmbE family N-acetylglucosaminyl deacetylase/SAM-dependent methyltransferase
MTTTFTPADPGTPEDIWTDAVARLPSLTTPGPGAVLVVVAAHPDDESLGAGGLIAAAAARGAQVHLVVATAGEASHPQSPTHTPARLAAIRRDEARAAAAALAPGLRPEFLDLPDGALEQHRTLLADRIGPLLDGADVVVSPWTGDGHPDHAACGAVVADLVAARRGVAHWQYPIWAWHWGERESLPWQQMARADLDDAARAAKRGAIAAHSSQHAPLSAADGDKAIVPPHVLAHFERGVETFIVSGDAPAASQEYFDDLYSTTADPWDLATRFYERRKRMVLVASLPGERFRRAFEPGCATGELTALLAARCDEVVAWDGAAGAIEQVRRRIADVPNVHIGQGRIPDAWPSGRFDLIVLSEVAYYCTDLDRLVARITKTLDSPGVVVACHWRRAAPDHPQRAETVHAALDAGLHGLHRVVHHDEGDFLLDVWSTDARSVAQREGIVA